MSKAVSSVTKAVSAVAAPIIAPVKATVSLAKGDISGAGKDLVGGFVSANPLQMADNATGGKVGQAAGYVPVIGSPVSKMLQAGSVISTGQFSGRDVKNYGVNSAKTAGLIYGGAALYGAAGLAPTITAAGAVSRGDYLGAATGAAGGMYGDDVNALKDQFAGAGSLFDYSKGFNALAGGGGGSPTPGMNATGFNGIPEAPAQGSILPLVVLGGAVFYFFFRRKK